MAVPTETPLAFLSAFLVLLVLPLLTVLGLAGSVLAGRLGPLGLRERRVLVMGLFFIWAVMVAVKLAISAKRPVA